MATTITDNYGKITFSISATEYDVNKSDIYDISINTILEVGDRITLLERLFNTRSGNMRIKDQFKPFIERRPDFFKSQESLLTSYYQAKGLSPEGLVTMETLKKSKLLGMVSI